MGGGVEVFWKKVLIIIPKFQLQIHYTYEGTEENVPN